jgi:hypothetical protein
MNAMSRYGGGIGNCHWRQRAGLSLAAILLACLAGCGGQPMPFPTPESEMGDRPGLFTGDKGAWDPLSRDTSSTTTR